MGPSMNRRHFLKLPLAAGLAGNLQAASSKRLSFLLLGDLHLDKLEHHDMAWMKTNKPDGIRAVQTYSRITSEIMPQLMASVRQTIMDRRKAGEQPVECIIQVGDFVEGLCGNLELAMQHNEDAIQFMKQADLGVPFFFTKGNHDITGDGAVEAYRNVFHPFLTGQARRFHADTDPLTRGFYTVQRGPVEFAFFDPYDPESLDWFEGVTDHRTAPHLFVIIHPPVIPYGARSTWHLYSRSNQKSRRERLLDLLGQQNATVLGGHIHKYNLSARKTPGGGRFVQLALSSVISAPNVTPKDELNGLKHYNADQIKVEPTFSPGTERERRAVYEEERPFVERFEYANLPGYAVVTVDGTAVEVDIYSGVSRKIWRKRNLVG
jgi:hypothetical protein